MPGDPSCDPFACPPDAKDCQMTIAPVCPPDAPDCMQFTGCAPNDPMCMPMPGAECPPGAMNCAAPTGGAGAAPGTDGKAAEDTAATEEKKDPPPLCSVSNVGKDARSSLGLLLIAGLGLVLTSRRRR